MKTIRIFVTMMLVGIVMGVSAQNVAKAAQLKEKATKEAVEEAERLKREGWKAIPGQLPIERQLDRSYALQYQIDEETMESKFSFGDGMSTGTLFDGAKLQATEIAKSDLIGKLTTEITTLTSQQLKNVVRSDGTKVSVEAAESKSKSLVSQRLNGITPIVELYRTLKDGTYEVMVKFAYARSKIVAPAVREISDELMKEDIIPETVQ